jgi:hypothetical protein
MYLGEVFDPEDYVTPCHTCPLDDLPVACAVCGENHVAADGHHVCQSCQSEALIKAIDSGAMDDQAIT